MTQKILILKEIAKPHGSVRCDLQVPKVTLSQLPFRLNPTPT